MSHLVALADDTTGALETGAHLAKAGLWSAVSLEQYWGSSLPALVIDTQTRHMAPDQVIRPLAQLMTQARAGGVRYLFKKTDSTLRGRIAAEFRALLSLHPGHCIVYAPAYPLMGRTVVDGHLLVNGTPVHLTEFAQDAANPVLSSDVVRMLTMEGVRTRHAPSPEALQAELEAGIPGQVVVCDAGSEEEQYRIAWFAAAYRDSCIVAGPASLAGYWASHLNLAAPYPQPSEIQAKRMLVLAGSRHPATQKQVRFAKGSGLSVYQVAENGGSSLATLGAIEYALQNRSIAVATCSVSDFAAREHAAEQLALIADSLLDRASVDTLAIFGGDTAYTVLRQLGVTVVEPVLELTPGVVASRFRLGDRILWLLTKAGGFGAPDLIPALWHGLALRVETEATP